MDMLTNQLQFQYRPYVETKDGRTVSSLDGDKCESAFASTNSRLKGGVETCAIYCSQLQRNLFAAFGWVYVYVSG